MALNRDEVVRTIGPVDDVVIAAIIATGATPDELAEARAWLENDEALINSGRAMATGRVGQLSFASSPGSRRRSLARGRKRARRPAPPGGA